MYVIEKRSHSFCGIIHNKKENSMRMNFRLEKITLIHSMNFRQHSGAWHTLIAPADINAVKED